MAYDLEGRLLEVCDCNVSKASRFKMVQPEIGVDLDLSGHNAIQGTFRLSA